MSVGLDLGTTEFRSIRDCARALVSRRCEAIYLALRDTPGHRRLLDHTQALYGQCGTDLVVIGDDARECSAMLDLPVIPLLREGLLSAADPVARQIVALMVEAVLPPAIEAGQVCCVALPGGYALECDTQSLDVRFLKQLVTLRGYRAQLVASGQAVVLAELVGSSFTGLGMSLGAANWEIGVIHCGREVARFTSPGLLAASAELPEESQRAALDKNLPRLLTGFLEEAREALVAEGAIRLIPQPISVACAGGITSHPGFTTALETAMSRSGWPLRMNPVRLATNPRFAIARGGLIQAILEHRAVLGRAA